MTAVAVRVLVLVVVDRLAVDAGCRVSELVAWIALLRHACQARVAVRTPLALAVLDKTLCVLRAWYESIEIITLLALLPLLTSPYVAFGTQEALVVFPKIHEAGTTMPVSCLTALIDTVHARLEAIVLAKS